MEVRVVQSLNFFVMFCEPFCTFMLLFSVPLFTVSEYNMGIFKLSH